MARGNETVRIGIQTVSEDEQAFDALNKKVKELQRNLRGVKDESKSQTDEMKQEVGDLDGVFENLGGTISNSFLSLAGVAGVVAGIGAQVIQTIQEVRRESTDFNIEKTGVLLSTGDTSAGAVASFEQQFSDLRRSTTRTENELLEAYAQVRNVRRGDENQDSAFEILGQTETGAASYLPRDQAVALREFVSRSVAIDPSADPEALTGQGMALMPSLGTRASQMESIMEGAEQAATLARDRGEDTAGVLASFNAAIVAGTANLRINQGADVVRAAVEGINEAMQMVEDPETGEMDFASPAIADVVNREGFGAGLLGLMGAQFSREEMIAAGIQGIDFQEFGGVARVLGAEQERFERGAPDMGGMGASLGSAAKDQEIARMQRENRISQRDQLAGGITWGQNFDETRMEYQAVNQEMMGVDLFSYGQAAIQSSIDFLLFDPSGESRRERESEMSPTSGVGSFYELPTRIANAPATIRDYMSSLHGPSQAQRSRAQSSAQDYYDKRREQQAQQQTVNVNVTVEAPEGLNVQSEVN